MPYNNKILTYAKKREMYGKITNDKDTGVGYVGNAACGDMLRVHIKVIERDGKKIIDDVKVQTYGCGCAIASTALAAEKLIGKTIEEALQLKDVDLANELELPAIKKHCSVLAEAAVKNAVQNYHEKQSGEWQEVNVSMFADVSKSQCTTTTIQPNSTCNNINTPINSSTKPNNTCCNSTNSTQTNSNTTCCNSTSSHNTHATTKPTTTCCNSINSTQANSIRNKLANFKLNINITNAAKTRFLEILQQYNKHAIFISTDTNGCAGNSYSLDVLDQQPEHSQIFTIDNLTLFIDNKAIMFVDGSTIDYQITSTEAGFKFTHPNLKTCGCGESFR